MDFWASDTSGKLHVKQVPWISLFNWNPRLFAFDNKHPPLPTRSCIKNTECDMDSKIFKEMVNEFRTKNTACRLFVEKYFIKKSWVFHLEYNN